MIATLPISIVSRLIEESSDAITVIDQDGNIRYLNGAMQALCGYLAGEALGQPLAGLLPEPVNQVHQAYIERYLASGTESTVLGKVRQFAIRHRSGVTIPIEMRALDLGVVDSVRYFGAFMTDLRPRLAAEAHNAALLAQLERQAMSDALTGLPNRRAFESEAARMTMRARRNPASIAIGIADIDHFKKINDEHGHPVGDEVLRAVSSVLAQAARGSDFVARIGGEEFGLLFADAEPDTASAVAERMRSAVENSPILAKVGKLNITVSIGLAQFAGSLSEALSKADRALYEAKHKGRNRVEQA